MESYNKEYFLKRWDDTVKSSPDRVALVDPTHPEGYTRKDVDTLSSKVCTYLKKNGIGANTFVMIYMSRTIDVFVAALGVFKAGGVFTIMEDHYPRERVEFIKQASNCKLEINDEVFADAIKEEPATEYVISDLHAPAFAVFTSGSTGNPKGVLHEYGNLGHMMDSIIVPYDGEEMRFALVAPLNFVASMLIFSYFLKEELFGIHVLPYDIVKNPKKLVEYIITKKTEYTFVSPSMMRASNNLIGLPLKAIFTGSEAATNVYNPSTPVINVYCMSETGFCTTQFTIDKPYQNCPVGKCESGVHKILLIKEDGTEITEVGVEGEICVENPYVRGYIGMPEETAKVFKDGYCHTNDLGKFDENGNLVYIGRSNDMIKINGNRVEPGEIEAVAKEAMGVSWCAAKGFSGASTYIALYYKDDINITEDEIRARMEKKLPYYMIPAYFVKIDEIPLTQTGKFNRKALPQPSQELNFAEYVAPTNEIEELLCNTFAKVLNVEKIGINDDFYQLGGDSLKSMQVIATVDSDFLTADDLFKGRTPKGTAELYKENEANSRGASWTDTEIDARKAVYELTGVEMKYVEEMLREKGKIGANLSRLVSFPTTLGAEKIADAMNKMINNRPIWGTVFFYDENNNLKQKYDESKLPKVEVEKMSEAEFDSIKGSLLPVFEPINSIMAVARVIETEAKIYVFMGMSHAKVDGYGERVFWNDIFAAYQGKELVLDSYYSCLLDARKNKESDKYNEAKTYFDEQYGNTEWLRALPTDKRGDDLTRAFNIDALPFAISDVEAAEKRLGASRNVIFAAITLATLANITKNTKVMLNWTYQDRSGRMKENAGGLTMKRLPIAIDVMVLPTFAAVLDSIKSQTIGGMSHSSYEWVCENEDGLNNDVMSFVYQPLSIMETGSLKAVGAQIVQGVIPNPGTARKFAVMVLEQEDGLKGTVNYMKGYYSEEKIKDFFDKFAIISKNIITNEKAGSLTALDIAQM